MIIMPFKAEHLKGLQLQAAQVLLQPELMSEEYGLALEKSSNAFSGMLDGKIVGACGVTPVWEGRKIAWAMFSPKALENFLVPYRAIKAFLDLDDTKRIEAYVDCDFKKAHVLARRLGFVMECERMRGFTPDGRDSSLYARIR